MTECSKQTENMMRSKRACESPRPVSLYTVKLFDSRGRKSAIFALSTFGPGEKNNVCTKYCWARRRNTIFALSTFGQGENTQYLH